MVSPEPIPEMRSSVSTRTRVASKCRRGWGSHAAANGGSSGRRSRSTLIDVIFTWGNAKTHLTGARAGLHCSQTMRSAALQRDLDILDALASEQSRHRSGLGVVAIATRLGRENSQVSRALSALAEAGMVERDPATDASRLGWRLYSYAAGTTEYRQVHLAVPALRRLVVGLGETAHLCV